MDRRGFIATLATIVVARHIPQISPKYFEFPNTLVVFDDNGHPNFLDDETHPGKIYRSNHFVITEEMIKDDVYGFPWRTARNFNIPMRETIDNLFISNRRLLNA